MHRAFRSVLILFALALLSLTPASARQTGAADPQRTIERFQLYLERKPFHETGFDKMVEAAIVANQLEELVAQYRERAGADEAALSDRVVLARLLARTDRIEEALGLLDELGDASAELFQLRGTLLLREHRVEEAVVALEAAAAATEDRQRLEEIHALRGAAWAEAGEREKAIAAWDDLVALDPLDYHLRTEAAAELSERGLPEAALVHYEAAIELAGLDVPELCRALSEVGRLHERLGRNEEALAAYARAREQLARGHWLKRDLEERTLAVHTRAGTLPDFGRELEAAVAENPRELGLRELQARALVQLRDLEGARTVLAAAAADYPQDLALARAHLRVLEELGDADARVREYQRILEHHPDDLELYVELGQVLASDGRLEQARRQWAKTLEGRMTDVGTCLRLSALHALFDMQEEAIALVERAIELEPQEIGHFGELAELHVRAGRREALAEVLDRAEAAAGEDTVRLDTAASLARGYRDLERAARLIEAARVERPLDARLARELADVALELGDSARATQALREIVSTAKDPAHRRDAADRLARLARRSGDLRELERAERMRLREEPADPNALYLAAVFALERGQESRARKYLEPLVEAQPEDDVARAMLAEVLLEGDDDEGAIAQYQALIELQPARRVRWLKEIARIHAKERRRDEAAAIYEEVLELSSGNPAAFREVAEAYSDMNREEDALECLIQATRLAPDDGDLRLALAELYEENDEPEKAEREVLRAVASEDDGVRIRARAKLHEQLVAAGEVDLEIERLREAVAQNPYDTEKPLALIDLFRREYEYVLAMDLLDELVRYRPRDAELLRQRADLLVELERYEDALGDFETLLRMPETDREDISYELASIHLELGQREEAEKLLVLTGDLVRAANLYHRSGLRAEAVELLEKAVGRTPDDRRQLRRLVTMKLEARDLDGALEVQERLVALDGETFENLKGRARILHARGDREGLYGNCVAMLEEAGPIVDPGEDEPDARRRKRALRRSRGEVQQRFNEVRQFLYQLQLYDGVEIVAERALQHDPTNPVYVSAALDALMTESRYADGMAAIDEVRAATSGAGVTPVGYDDAEDWEKYLERREANFVRASPELAAQRAAELGAASTQLSRDEIDELVDLYERQESFEELGLLLEDATARFPEEEEYLAALAFARIQTDELEAAETALRELLGDSPRAPRGLDVPEASRSYKKRLKRKLSDELYELLDDATLARRAMLDDNCPYRDRFKLGSRPKDDDVRLQLARCLAAQERDDEARAILREMEPAERDLVETRAFLAGIHRELDYMEEFDRLRDSVYEVVTEVGDDPRLRAERKWANEVVAIVTEKVAELGLDGQPAVAWELFRRWAGPDSARALLGRPGVREEVLAARKAAWDAALAAAPAEVPDPTGDLRDAGVLYAELLVDAAEWRAAGDIYRTLSERDPEDLQLAELVGRTLERDDRVDEAIAHYETIAAGAIERVREAQKAPAGPVRDFGEERLFDPYELVPSEIPPARPDPSGVYGELMQAGRFGLTVSTPNDWVPWDLYCSLFRLEFEAERYADAALRLEALGRISGNVPGYIQYELRSALESKDAGAEGLPLWELLYGERPSDGQLVEAYGKALIDLERTDEAIRIYRKYLRDSSIGDYRREQIEKALVRLEPESAEAAGSTTKELIAAVEADPKNVRLRSSLVARLIEEARYEEAAVHAVEAARLAPHLDDVRRAAGETLALAGHDDEYIDFLGAELERLVDPEARFQAALRLAQLLDARGESEAAVAVLDTTVREGNVKNAGNYSAARFLLERGQVEAAFAQLDKEIEGQAGSGQWQVDRLREVSARLALIQGDPVPTLDRVWEQSGQGALSVYDANRFDQLVSAVASAPEAARAAELIERAAQALESTAAESGRARVYRAVAASLDATAATYEESLMELALESESARELGLRAVTAAREREEWSLVDARLTRLTERYPPRQRNKVPSAIGSLSEVTSLAAERGTLQLLQGDREAALATWRAAFEGDREAPLLLARLCADHGLYESAHAALDDWQASGKTLKGGDHLIVAAIARAAGDDAATLEALELAAMTNPSSTSILAEMERCHRALGSLSEHRERLAAGRLADVGKAYVAERLIALTEELEGAEATAALIDGWEETPAQSLVELYLELSRRASADGDPLRALELFERANNGDPNEWSRNNRRDELARLYLAAGQPDEASSTYRARYGDEDSAQAWVQWASLLRRLDEDEMALTALRQALEIEDDGLEAALNSALISLIDLELDDEALALVLEEVADPVSASSLEGIPGLQALLLRRDVRAQVEAELAAAPDDPAALARAAFVDYVLERRASAAERLERLLELVPDHRMARGLVWKALRDAGRYEDALAALELELDREDRRQVLETPGSGARTLQILRADRARIAHRIGGIQAARAAALGPLGRRFALSQLHQHNAWNLGGSVSTIEAGWLYDLGDDEGYLEQTAVRDVLEPAQARSDTRRWKARLRTEPVEDVLAALFQACADERSNDALRQLLIQAYDERGDLDDLITLVDAARAAQPDDDALKTLEWRLITRQGREEEALAQRLDGRDEDELPPQERFELARLAHAAGQYETAWRLARPDGDLAARSGSRANRAPAAPKWFGRTPRTATVHFSYAKQDASPSFSGGMVSVGSAGVMRLSSVSSFSSYSGPQRADSIDFTWLHALACLAGSDEAATLEALRREQLAAQWGLKADLQIGDELLQHGALERGEQLLRAHADAHPEDLSRVLGTLADAYLERGERSDRDRCLSEWLAAFDVTGDKETPARLWARIRRLTRHEAELEQLRADLARIAQLDPNGLFAPAADERAWLHLQLGRPRAALALFREQQELDLYAGRLHQQGAGKLYGFGFALAEVEGLEAARDALREALASHPDSRHAARARELVAVD